VFDYTSGTTEYSKHDEIAWEQKMGESVRRLSLEGLATDRTLSPSGVEMMGAKSGRSAQQKDGMQQDGKQQVKSQQATTQQKYEDALRRSIKRANEAEDMKNAEELVSKLQVMKDEAQQIVFQMQGSPLPGQATERSKSVSDVLDFPGKQTLNLNKEALESRPATGDSATRLLRLDEQARHVNPSIRKTQRKSKFVSSQPVVVNLFVFQDRHTKR